MSTHQPSLLCHYRYDPLDRLTSQTQPDTAAHQRFYCKSRLATEIQGALQHSIVQYDDLLLAQQQRQGDDRDIMLLSTDLQRSVLHTLKANEPSLHNVFTPYGHHFTENGLTRLLGFNGERPDPVTGHYLLGNGYRAFNPVLMRFNSPDSLSPFGKAGLNSYVYCLGDPINFYDPNGQFGFRVATNLLRWRSRAALKMVAMQSAADEVANSGIILLDKWSKYALMPDVTPMKAVKMRNHYDNLMFLGSGIPLDNSKFFADLSYAKKAAARLEEMTGIPAAQNERLKFLNYIYVPDIDSRLAFSTKRVHEVSQGRFDPRVPLPKRPKPESAIQYRKELLAITDHNSKDFYDEAYRVRDEHFIRIK
jgi:RHS repeat-associated protein